jgi:hypothetical protein
MCKEHTADLRKRDAREHPGGEGFLRISGEQNQGRFPHGSGLREEEKQQRGERQVPVMSNMEE